MHLNMKVSLTLKGAADIFGRVPVYIRFSDGQKRTFQKTSISLTPDQFQRFKSFTHLPKEKDLYQRWLNVMDEPEKPKDIGFIQYCLKVSATYEIGKTDGTMKVFRSGMNKFKRFRPNARLQDITPTLLEEYRIHLAKEKGNNENTQNKSFTFLRKIIHRALKDKLITENPFDTFDIPKYTDPPKQFLTQEEIDKIESLENLPLPDKLKHVATWFVIGCYTGLRYGDMRNFDRKKHIVNGRLMVHTLKTGELISIPFTDKMKELFERIDYQRLMYANQKYNGHLKQVQELCDIRTTLSAHVSRHSAAVRWADRGMSIEVVGKLLGQTSLKTTAIYFKITGTRINDEFSKFG